MSLASASARARFRSTSTISRPTPLITSAYAEVEPTMPQPTMPIFMVPLDSFCTPRASSNDLAPSAWRVASDFGPHGIGGSTCCHTERLERQREHSRTGPPRAPAARRTDRRRGRTVWLPDVHQDARHLSNVLAARRPDSLLADRARLLARPADRRRLQLGRRHHARPRVLLDALGDPSPRRSVDRESSSRRRYRPRHHPVGGGCVCLYRD